MGSVSARMEKKGEVRKGHEHVTIEHIDGIEIIKILGGEVAEKFLRKGGVVPPGPHASLGKTLLVGIYQVYNTQVKALCTLNHSL